MQKLLLSIFFYPFLGSTILAQQKITFAPQVQPQNTYIQKMEQTSFTEIIYEGLDEAMQKKIAQNQPQNMNREMHFTMESLLTTGKANKNASFPIRMEVTKSNSNDSNFSIPIGTTFYGKCLQNELPEFDSIASVKDNKAFLQNALKILQAAQQQYNTNGKKLGILDTFSQTTNVDIPIGGSNLKVNITSLHTLINIENGIATFDVKHVFNSDYSQELGMPEIKGTGNGKILYDIANEYLQESSNKMEMDMKMEMGSAAVIFKVVNNIVQNGFIVSK